MPSARRGVAETPQHLFVDCRVTRGVVRRLLDSEEDGESKAARVLYAASIDDYLFLSRNRKQYHLLQYVCMSRAVWRARWDTKDTRLNHREREDLVLGWFRKSVSRAKAGSFRRRDRTAEGRQFGEMLAALPPAHHAYTDGSAYKCTDVTGEVETVGPSGCGAYVLFQDDRELFRSVPLGAGTNGMAEVHGVIAVAEFFLWNEPDDEEPL